MARLHDLLHNSAQLAITAATGMGGIGKTDLAWHYAEAHRAEYAGGIWWMTADQVVVKVLEYSRRMQLPEAPEDLDEAAKVQWYYQRWLEAIPTENRLLVWDDVADAAAYRELRPFLPNDARFRLLITTRVKLGQPVQRLELGVLKRAAAFRLLRQLVDSDQRIAAEVKTAKALCERVGRLPLGIELIGRHLALHPTLRLEVLLERLEAKRLQSRALQQVPDEMSYRDNLEAAFEVSWQSLSESAQQVGELLSLFGAAPIPKALIGECLPEWDEEDLEDCLDRELVGSSLAGIIEQGRYLLHPLVREFFAAKGMAATHADKLQQGFVRAMTAIAETIPYTVTLEVIDRVKAVIPHLEAATQHTNWLDEDDFGCPYTGVAWFYQGQSLWQQAEQWHSARKTMSEARFGADHPQTAQSLNNLAILYQSQGRYSEAEPPLLQALEIKRTQLGDNHPDTATSLNNLAWLYRAQGRYSEAEPLYLQALEIKRTQLGDNHPDTALSLNNLAALYYSQGRYSEAEPLYQQALEIKRTQLGDNHPDTAFSLLGLGALYVEQGNVEAAIPLLQAALAIRQQVLGDSHPYTQVTRSWLERAQSGGSSPA
jgi:tetratricopeptide (TPR) repeat protein